MELNARNGPKMTEEQITAYLARIGISSPVPLTLEGLGKLQMAHRLTVPFENLDIVAGRPLSLELPHLYDKIVRRRQGGDRKLPLSGGERQAHPHRLWPPAGQR